jgi:hypothetical protein
MLYGAKPAGKASHAHSFPGKSLDATKKTIRPGRRGGGNGVPVKADQAAESVIGLRPG